MIPKRYNLESSASIGYSEQNFIMGRSLGIGSITIYQLWNSVSSVVHANSLTKILFRGEDIEKMKNSINLSEEQFNYLAHLSDRNYILKSKNLSGPALLKTRTFNRLRFSREDYLKLAEEKFSRSGLNHKQLSKSLMNLRKEIFEKKTSIKENIVKQKPNRRIEIEKKSSTSFRYDFWEWCINSCPARLEFRDKNSNWIRENICKDIQIKAQEIANNLINNEEPTPLIEIINKNPKYLANKILNYSMKDSAIKNPKILTYCTMNIILSSLKTKFNFTNSWKNNSLTRVKSILSDESITGYSIF
ncbi:MAG: hypothetical protein ACTSSH_13600 [Candidatus Heimdallarchaeota archaeon]